MEKSLRPSLVLSESVMQLYTHKSSYIRTRVLNSHTKVCKTFYKLISLTSDVCYVNKYKNLKL